MTKVISPDGPPGAVDAVLRGRLASLRVDGDCCKDLPAVLKAARSALASGKTRRRYEALAEPARLLVLAMLRRQPELCGCEIQAALRVTHPTVSHHMRVLIDAGLVRSERRGRWTYYMLEEAARPLVP